MVGAVVGVQPFGGEGLSGTGPKAGGPLYLHRLADSTGVTPAMLDAPIADGATWQTLEVLHAFSQWAETCGYHALVDTCRDYAGESLLPLCLTLPGSTGERNTLRFAPRGRLLCLAQDIDALLAQLAAVFATGNQAAVGNDAAGRALIALLPSALAACVELRAPDDCTHIAGVLYDGGEEESIRRQLAERDGPLLPLFRPAGEIQRRRYPLYRLLSERVLSVNTTAAGGNTTLMTLDA
jgi:RHH-type proline utilization regulon transcriptional repressor/proline dehydrogenase/delta 1-pyrroline-5-carboxylate dehydrogenase